MTISVALGPNFEERWKRAPLGVRREIMAELRDIYRMLDEDDLPVLDLTPGPSAASSSSKQEAPVRPDLTPRSDNPFLPKSVLEKLASSQAQANAQLQQLMQTHEAMANHDSRQLEQELRQRLGPMVESLIEEHIQGIKAELRFRLRSEMDRLIAETLKKR